MAPFRCSGLKGNKALVSTLVFLMVLIYSVWRGYRRGFQSGMVELVGLAVAYAVAWIAWQPFGHALSESGWFPGLSAYLAAPCMLFFGVSLAFQIPHLFLRSMMKRREARGDSVLSQRVAGAVLGLGTGFVYAVLAVWSVMFLLRDGVEERHVIERISGRIVGATVAFLLDSRNASDTRGVKDIVQALTRDPGTAVKQLENLTRHEGLQQLLSTPEIQRQLTSGQPEELARTPEFRALLQDPALSRTCIDLGLLDSDDPDETRGLRLARVLSRTYQKLEQVKNHPELRAALQDPAWVHAMEQGDMGTILTDPRSLQIARLLLESPVPPSLAETPNAPPQPGPLQESATPSTPKPAELPVKDRTFYKWKDEQGRLHITDEPPPKGAEVL